MDLFDLEDNSDPTLPLNEASVLPSQVVDHDSQWNVYRNSTEETNSTTPRVQESKAQDDDGDGDEPKSMRGLITNRSLVSTVVGASRRGGYTIKDVEEELAKLRHENFNLKLRIHLLEEHQGLTAARPGDAENVIRINLDLRVEKESLKNEIEEKNKLLEDAYVALDILEKERDSDRQLYEDQILRLKSYSENSKPNRESKVQKEILLEAFGSLNLGDSPEDDSNSGLKLQQLKDDLQATNEKCKELEEEKSVLQKNLEHALLEIKNYNEEIQFQANSHEKALKDADSVFETEFSKIKSELKESTSEANQLRLLVSEKDTEIDDLTEVIAQLKASLNQIDEAHKDSESVVKETISHYRQETEELRAKIISMDEEIESVQEKKASLEFEVENSKRQQELFESRIDQLQSIVQDLEANILTKNMELEKTRACVAGLAEIDLEQKDQISKLEYDVKMRSQALEKLKEEYEKAKSIVRRYRSEKQSLENKENISNNPKDRNIFDFEKGKISELEREVLRLKQELEKREPGIKRLETDEELMQIVKHEMTKMKKTFVRKGAERAIGKAETVFSKEMKRLESVHHSVIRLMQKRLGELSTFLMKFCSQGNLDFSMMTDMDKENLHRSLNSSRRLSVAFNPDSSMNFGDISITSNLSELTGLEEDEQLPEFKVPSISIKLTDEDLDAQDEDISVSNVDVENSALTIVTGAKEKMELQARVVALEKMVSDAEQAKLMVDKYYLEKQQFQERELRIEELEDDLKRNELELSRFKSKYADASSTVDDLRIQLGQAKEKYREKINQCGALEEKIRLKSESSNEVNRLKNEISKMELKIKENQAQVKKLEAEAEVVKAHNTSEVEKLRLDLKEALEKIKAFRERQERLDRAILPQLAKTHHVLKKTKAMLDNNSPRS